MFEKLRRKVWGTDKPPGVKDPYGSESQLDHVEPLAELSEPHSPAEMEMEEGERGIRIATAEEKEHGEYKSADTWEGLRQVGVEQWWESPRNAEDYFEPYVYHLWTIFLLLFFMAMFSNVQRAMHFYLLLKTSPCQREKHVPIVV